MGGNLADCAIYLVALECSITIHTNSSTEKACITFFLHSSISKFMLILFFISFLFYSFLVFHSVQSSSFQ